MCTDCNGLPYPQISRKRELAGTLLIPKQQLKHADPRVICLVFPGQIERSTEGHREDIVDSSDSVVHLIEVFANNSEVLNTRRSSVNAYFISLSSALAGLTLYTASIAIHTELKWHLLANAFAPIVVFSIFGLLLSCNWQTTIRNYRLISRSKIEIMMALETRLPARSFTTQYDIMEENNYSGMTDTEENLAKLFAAFFICTMAGAIFSLLIYNPGN